MKSKKNLIIIAIVIAISLLGITYAFFDYYMLGANQKITAGAINLTLNEGEDTINRGNIFPETVTKARGREDNFITFTVSGINTTEDQDIYYEIMLNEGDVETGMTRFNSEDLVFDLVELKEDGTDGDYVVDAMSFNDFNARRIWVDTVDRNTSSTFNKTYKLRMWLSEDVLISDSNSNANYPSTGYENYYASVKVSVYGDFIEKKVEYPANYMAKLNSKWSFWPTILDEQKANISEVNFISLNKYEIGTRYDDSTIKAIVTDDTLGGSVFAWLETDPTDTTKYIMYVASNGTTYFPSDCSYMFDSFNSLKSVYFENVSVQNVNNMLSMFNFCYNLTDLNLSDWNTSNVTNLSAMFSNCQKLESVALSNWDTSKVTDIGNMFYKCLNLRTIDLSDWDTSNVTRIEGLFSECQNLSSININNWDLTGLSSVYNNGVIYGCSLINDLSIDGWKLDDTFVFNTFLSGSSVTSLELTNFDLSESTSMNNMFYNCTNLTSLKISGFNTSNIKDMSSAFCGLNLTVLDLRNLDVNSVTNMSYMFNSCPNLTTIYVNEDWNTGKVASYDYMFYNSPELVGAVPFDSTKTDITMANPDTGYFTRKEA